MHGFLVISIGHECSFFVNTGKNCILYFTALHYAEESFVRFKWSIIYYMAFYFRCYYYHFSCSTKRCSIALLVRQLTVGWERHAPDPCLCKHVYIYATVMMGCKEKYPGVMIAFDWMATAALYLCVRPLSGRCFTVNPIQQPRTGPD